MLLIYTPHQVVEAFSKDVHTASSCCACWLGHRLRGVHLLLHHWGAGSHVDVQQVTNQGIYTRDHCGLGWLWGLLNRGCKTALDTSLTVKKPDKNTVTFKKTKENTLKLMNTNLNTLNLKLKKSKENTIKLKKTKENTSKLKSAYRNLEFNQRTVLFNSIFHH